MRKIYAVIDTNVLVSALLTSNLNSATVRVLDALLRDLIVPLYDAEILAEYKDVLGRSKFGFSRANRERLIELIKQNGIESTRVRADEIFPDPKDVVFYEVALSKEDAYLVTGNKKHFPATPIVVTPAEMMDILEKA